MNSSIGKLLNKLFALTLFLIMSSACWAADTFFVSLNGNDANAGTKENPFATIDRAKAAAGNSRSKIEPVTIFVRGGTYIFQKTLQFNESDRNILIKPWAGESVIFTGGVSINPTKVRRLSLTEYKNEFPEFVQDKIGVLDLRELGISDYGQLRSVGFARPYAPSWLELFINENPGHLARWPNDSTMAMGRVIDKGSVVRDGDQTNRGGKFAYETNRPSSWKKTKDIWLSGYFNVGYAEDAVKLASLDTLAKTFTTAQPHIYGFLSGKAWNRWYAYNIPEEIDQNGEYYLDRERGLLFFFLPTLISKLDISMLQTPLVSIEGSKNITFQGISFEVSRGIGVYLERSESCVITDCVFRNLGSVAVSIGKGIAPFEDQKHEGSGKAASQLIGSVDQHLYENPTFEREGGRNNRIVNCHIYHTGAGGIRLSGGDRISLTPAGNSIENCRIHDFNRIEKSYRPGIGIDGVGNSILNCEIYNAPSMAILLHGNDHVLEYNNIYDVCREIDDQGAFYYGRDPSERGHKLRFNYFHHFGNNHRTSAIYHDDGASGMEVFGNIFYKAGTIPVLIGGGQDISYKNNLFIDSPLGIHVDNRFQNWSKATLAKDGVIDKRLKAVKFDQPPYAVKYPELVNYWKQDPSVPKRLIFDNNIFVKVATTRKGEDLWFNWSENNRVMDTYPYNWKMMDSRHFIPDDSQLITPSGWQTLPVEKIGILKNYK
ncbi:right-handed parallel beta-helix repeat-containing protein [Dyadobacter sp. CY345]|uniref:right-handed parallel beta-helix repeat-containing protein n=1 Tax=Dyadobacter sp. CY345 TaxID=2909335 RepID=UPI001F409D55|nr:right-handed parallel beta-helix repeat-containing protein [Dyadobacter sp. CY345]MCF2443178.1 right-handed parallel beta-helix repeat-containing protein [Dyadobacter sp. CY345]